MVKKFLLATTLLYPLALAAQELPNHAIPVGRGPGAAGLGALPTGSTGQVLTSQGATADPIWAAGGGGGGIALPVACGPNGWMQSINVGGVTTCAQPDFTNLSGHALVAQGGTGLTSGSVNSIPYFNTASTMANLIGSAGTMLQWANPPIFTVGPTLGTTGSAGSLTFNNVNANSVKLQPPSTLTNWTFTFPQTAGTSGQVLSTDGTGITSWITGGGGGLPDAPSDGLYYVRRNAAWVNGATYFAPLASPAFTGTPTAPTPAAADNSTTIATTAFVNGSFVKKSGDTMTGQLAVSYANPVIKIDKAASGQASFLIGSKGGLSRWQMQLGNATAETGSNVGSDFSLDRMNDATGALIDSPLTIVRSTGQATLNQTLNVPAIKPTADSTSAFNLYKADGSTSILRVDSTNRRIGINKIPGAFDLDTNSHVNVGGVLTFSTLDSTSLSTSTSTITGLTVGSAPNATNDYFLYFSAADGRIRKCTLGSCSSAGAAGVTSLNGATGALTLVGAGTDTVSTAGSTITVKNNFFPPPGGRLSSVSFTPVLPGGVNNVSSTLYYMSYVHTQVPYFDGTNDQAETIPGNQVQTVMASSGTGVLNASQVFDVWWVHGGANRICIATDNTGQGWAGDAGGSNTARGTGYTALSRSRGYITNTNAINYCYNGTINYGTVGANQGTYLGTILTTGIAAQVSVYYNVSAVQPIGWVGIWNAYNRVPISGWVSDSTANWTYGAAVWSPINGGGNYINFVQGMAEEAITAEHKAHLGVPAGYIYTGVGVDSATGLRTAIIYFGSSATVRYDLSPVQGYHYVQASALGDGTNAQTLFGGTLQQLSYTSRY